MSDVGYFEKTRKKIIRTREWVSTELVRLGFEVLSSSTNFLCMSSKTIPGNVLYDELKRQGVLVRHFGKERINNFIRVSIGTDKDMRRFLNILREMRTNEL